MALKTGVSWLYQPIIHLISSQCEEVSSLTGLISDLSHRTISSSGNLYRSRRQDNSFQTNTSNCHKLHYDLHLPCGASGTQLHSKNVFNTQIKT